ncbi:hypothetical protein SADUNF_Sadunf02G0064600 [Salix dunnii]|uniref:Uncharacterized protein n=1 Tax=Salix dunnii TaxID=1413687 RepID=A0A835N6E9_9ROSI|nr:hypothetical protein SADUNF_Sadunf02G0064600 [Salix dunnii]
MAGFALYWWKLMEEPVRRGRSEKHLRSCNDTPSQSDGQDFPGDYMGVTFFREEEAIIQWTLYDWSVRTLSLSRWNSPSESEARESSWAEHKMMRQQAGPNMTVKLNSGEAAEAKTETEQVNRVTKKTEPWFNQKKGSVFPKKKRSVKSMMLGYIGRSIAPPSPAPPAFSPEHFHSH